VDDAETLLWIAISTYEPDDLAYHRLLERVLALAAPRRLGVARVGAPLLGCHLRWGFPHLYERDLWRMRADNFIDYPWLFFSVAELAREYARLADTGGAESERLEVAAALLNGMSPDPEAFLGDPPASLGPWREEHVRVRAFFADRREALLRDFARHAPLPGRYSPLGFHFNFPHNAVFAMAVLALVGGDAPNLSLNALLTGEGEDVAGLAERLTAFAAANPEPRGSRSVLGLYCEEDAAERAFADVIGTLQRVPPSAPRPAPRRQKMGTDRRARGCASPPLLRPAAAGSRGIVAPGLEAQEDADQRPHAAGHVRAVRPRSSSRRWICTIERVGMVTSCSIVSRTRPSIADRTGTRSSSPPASARTITPARSGPG
jgi:hypothetical protein